MRARLTAWVVAIFTVIQWSTGAVYWLYQSRSLDSLLSEQLAREASIIARDVDPWLPGLTQERLGSIARRELAVFRFDNAFIEVFTLDGQNAVEGRTPVLPGDPQYIALAASQAMPVVRKTTLDLPHTDDPVSARVAYYALRTQDRGEYVIAVATTDAFIERQLDLLTRVLVLGGIIGPIAAAAAGWFIGGIAVAPFDRLRELAERISPESIGRSLDTESSNAEVARLAMELDHARVRIQEGFAAQERFLSNVSHEIKTPIAVMLVEAQTINTDGSPQHVKYFIESVAEEMQRLGKLVESFLTLTRVRDGKGVVRMKSYAVNDLMMDSAEHCAPMADQYRVRLNPRLLDREPEMDAAIAGEPELLVTMLDNLVRNGIRFSPTDERLEITAEIDKRVVHIRVRDYGPGIPEDQLKTIFDRFGQAPDEVRKGRGHGLGLVIAQGIAELHGGSIKVENCDDSGCVFMITLPLL